jgi:hypothetical protein
LERVGPGFRAVASWGIIPAVLLAVFLLSTLPLGAQTVPTTTLQILAAAGGDYSASDHYFNWSGAPINDGSSGLIIINGSTLPSSSGVTLSVNSATSSGGANYSVAGGGSLTVAVTSNTVNVTAAVAHSVYGGLSAVSTDTGSVQGNKVSLLNGATVALNALGGFALRGVVDGNSVEASSGATITGSVFGGAVYPNDVTAKADVTNNKVVLSGGAHVAGDVVTGYSSGGLNGKVTGNEFTMREASQVEGLVLGGYVYDGASQTLSGNKATIYGGTVGGAVIGAMGSKITNSQLTGNSVTLSGTSASAVLIQGEVYGAYVEETVGNTGNTLSGNTVTINGGTLNGRISGAQVSESSNIIALSATLSGNTVNITASTGAVTIAADVHGGHIYGDGVVRENTVNVGGGSANTISASGSDIYGGMLSLGLAGEATRTAEANAVNLTGVNFTVKDVYGGYAGRGLSNFAQNNIVDIKDAYNQEAGSYGTFGNVYGGYVIEGNATGNTVNLENAYITGMVYGGYVSTAGNATGNTVTLSGNIGLSATAVLMGGFSGSGDGYTGNTLIVNNIVTPSDGKLLNIQNFERFSFVLSGALLTDNYAVLRTADMVLEPDRADQNAPSTFDMTRLNILGGEVLRGGDKIVLIQADNAISLDPDTDKVNLDTVTVNHGIYMTYDAQIALEGSDRQLTATITGVHFNEQSHSLAEMGVASLGLINRSTDMIADEAIPASMASSLGMRGYTVFATVRVGKERFQSGSHVDLMGVTGQLGVAMGTETASGYGTLGAFLEYGRAEYDSYNSFDAFPYVHGNGTVTYLGGGLLGRYDMGQSGRSHPYFEASAHMGTSKADFGSPDFGITIINGDDQIVETSGRYFGYHAGMGYFLEFADSGNPSSLDISAKYLYSEREAMSADVFGVKAEFGKVQSSRIRAGGRYVYGMTDLIKPFVGGYYEREFQGGSSAKIGDTVIPEASVKGSTGIGELGVTLTSATLPIDLEVGVKGFGGERDGVVGGLKFNYSF